MEVIIWVIAFVAAFVLAWSLIRRRRKGASD